MTELQRLSKLMSQRGLCSRREADRYIEQGLVKVNGKIVNQLGVKFSDDIEIVLLNDARQQQAAQVTIMLNKPVGYVSAQAEKGYQPAVRLITEQTQSRLDHSGQRLQKAHFNGLAPAGRLDIDSQGLLILTQNGRIAKQLIGADSSLEKEYLVRVQQRANQTQLEKLRHGLELDGKALKRARVEQINDDQLRFVLREGKKRQIRRMCDAVGLSVRGLKRVRIGQLRLGQLEEGQWRFVQPQEFHANG